MEVTLDEDTATAVLGSTATEEKAEEQEEGGGKPSQLRFTLAVTERIVTEILLGAVHLKTGGVQCTVCSFVATCPNRLKVHVRQHFTNHICGCGESSYRRDWVLEHLRKEKLTEHFGEKGCRTGRIYEVDGSSFSRFKRETGNPAVVFLPVRPADDYARPCKPPGVLPGAASARTTPGVNPGKSGPSTPGGKPGRNSPAITGEKPRVEPPQKEEGELESEATLPPTPIYQQMGPSTPAPNAGVKLPTPEETKQARKEERRIRREERRLRRRALRAAKKPETPIVMGPPPRPKTGSTHTGRRRERSAGSQSDRSAPKRPHNQDLRHTLHDRRKPETGVTSTEQSRKPTTTGSKGTAAHTAPRAASYAAAVSPSSTAPRSAATITLSKPTVYRVAPPHVVAQMLSLETQAHDLYHHVVLNHPDPVTEAKADALANAISEARRRATLYADTDTADTREEIRTLQQEIEQRRHRMLEQRDEHDKPAAAL